MARFSEQFKGQNLVSMHATNPQPFTQDELEHTIGRTFNSIIQDVNLGFSADEGSLLLRESLATHLYENINADDVVAHAGAQEALYCAFYALLKVGDKVLVVSPIFEPLVKIPYNIGCEINYIHLDPDDNWSLDLNEVESQFKQGCEMFIINFPHNPTGKTLSIKELSEIIGLCQKYDVWLLSDEVFRGLEHELKFRLPAVVDMYNKGISVGVTSKAYALPGLRIGWLVCQNQQLRQRVIDIKGYLSICNSQIDEILTSVLLQSSEKLLKRNLKIIKQNKTIMHKISSVFGQDVEINIPDVGCCVFAQIKGKVASKRLVKIIAERYKYLLYPSSLFETKVNGLRIGFGNDGFNKFYNQSKNI